jgi:HK97 family phage portal protein
LANPADWLLESILGDLSSMSGVSVTPLKALGVSTVYSVVNVTANALSTLPLVIYQKKDGQKTPATNHPLNDLVSCSPNEFMTAADFFTAQEANRTLRGNSFAQIVRNGRGEVVELIPLENEYVQYNLTTTGPVYYYKTHSLSFQEVLHVKGLTFNGHLGAATTSHVRDVIGLAIALQDNAGKFFANGSKVADVLGTDARLSPDQRADLAKVFRDRKEKGEDYSALILDNGLKYVAHRSENRDSQMMEARRLQREEIAAAFGIPASKVGILDSATFSNIEQLGIDFVISYLQPICVKWEQALNQRLLTKPERQNGLYFKFDLRGLMRGDATARAAYFSTMINAGVMVRNEARLEEELNPLPGLDEPLAPLNMATPKSEENSKEGFFIQALDSNEQAGLRRQFISTKPNSLIGHTKNKTNGRAPRP